MRTDDALAVMRTVVAIGILIDSVEILYARRYLAADGIFSYRVIRTTHDWLVRPPLARPFGAIYRYRTFVILLTAQAAVSALLVANIMPALTTACLLFLLAGRLLLHMRLRYGLDGSDQMFAVILTGLVVAGLDASLSLLALTFVALQSLLSYVVAGVAKAVSPSWRSGRAIVGILSTESYGHPKIARQLLRGGLVPRVLCWSVIGFECFGPVLAFLGGGAAIVLISAGVAFHLSIAFLMGLNSFAWAFTAAYPAVYVFAEQWPNVVPW